MPKTPRRGRAAAAILALPLTLAACGDGVGPGTAAQVDGERISVKDVDDLARIICATQQGPQEGGKSPTAQVRALALNVLLGIHIGEGIGDLDSADKQTVSQSLQSAAQARALVPEEDRDLFDQVVRDSTAAQLVVNDAAARELRASGGDPTNQTQLQTESAKLQAEWLDKADIEVAPRFGHLSNGQLVAADGSLSVPVSKRAKELAGGSSDDPFGAGSEADYPASQRCS
jgi:hypothetical protein